MTKELATKEYPTIACCGLDCGLCPVYYSKGPSRCPGCCGHNFQNRHPSCGIITCCVKEHKFETCAECHEFPCPKIDKWDKVDSFISHRVSLSNLKLIKEKGIEQFFNQQQKRIELLDLMLKNFNEGRSKSFYCIAAALLPIKDIEKALKVTLQVLKNEKIDSKDVKSKSNIFKRNLTKVAEEKSIILKLKKK